VLEVCGSALPGHLPPYCPAVRTVCDYICCWPNGACGSTTIIL